MRTLLFIVLTATLVGCFAPPQMQQLALTGCTGTTGAACSGGAADVLQANSSPPAWQDHPAAKTEKIAPAKKANARHRRETNTRIQNARSHIVPKTDVSSGQRDTVITAQPTAPEVKSKILQSSQLDDDQLGDKKSKGNDCSKNGEPSIGPICRDEAVYRKRCTWQIVQRRNLRLRRGEKRFRRKHRGQTVSLSRSQRRGLHRRYDRYDRRL